MEASRWELLTKRRFAPLFVALVLGSFTNNLFKTATLIAIVFRISPDDPAVSASQAAIAAGIFAAPHFLFASIAGQLADRVDKARMARLIKGADVFVMAFGAAALALGSLSLLLLVLFLSGVRGALFSPVKYAMLPHHLRRGELLFGTGLVQAGGVVAGLAGQLCAALLPMDATNMLLVVLPAIAFGASCMIPPAQSIAPQALVDWNIGVGIPRVLRDALAQPALRLPIAGISWFYAVGSVFTSQFAPLVRNELGGDEGVVSLFLIAFAAGVTSGALAVHRLLKGKISLRLVPISAAAAGFLSLDLWIVARDIAPSGGVGATAFLAQASALRLIADLFLLAASAAMSVVPLYTRLQTAGDPAKRARDIAANNILNAFAVLLITIVAGLALKMGASVPSLFAVIGLATLALALAARSFRR
jgi:acyl-[acyl-carrier-protein]-phospholipid O-acyltransferase/long-chain-fatty-acid--[acyl-carrier-protein] ligase